MKPYIICHRMRSIDGRIDCARTSKIEGSKEYYETLDALDTPANLSGRVTAELERAEGDYVHKDKEEPIGKELVSRKKESSSYQIIADTKGTLLWPDDRDNTSPLIILLSKKAGKDYLGYLDQQNISYIVCGEEKIDLKKACDILYQDFKIRRMAIVGGGTINGAFLADGLLDEVSILLGPGIDGRQNRKATFDGLERDKAPTRMKLKSLKAYEDGAVWIRYTFEK